MKKIFTLLNLVALLSLGALTASCERDPDTEESMVLSGQWQGDWGLSYDYEYRGRVYTFDSFDTDIVFYPDYDYATHGYGYQVDWYRTGPYSRMSFRFEWSIRNGVINVAYPGYPEYDTTIYDYTLTNDYFAGRMGDHGLRFNLTKLADYYDWGYYRSFGDYYYWTDADWTWGGYYAKTRGVAADSTEEASTEEPTEGRIVKIRNRYAKK